MIVRRGRPYFRVSIEVPHTGGLRAWGAAAGTFERWLAAQLSPIVSEARVESETRRGRDSVRVRIAVTTRAADLGQAAVIAWDVFRTAAGEDIAAWDTGAATAMIEAAPLAAWASHGGSRRYRGSYPRTVLAAALSRAPPAAWR